MTQPSLRRRSLGTVDRVVDPLEIAARLAPAIRWPGAPDVDERSWRLVALTSDFDVWVIAWPHGGRVLLHDHGHSSGALVVLEGALVETTPWRDDTGRLTLQRRELGRGATRRFRKGHVHDVTNGSEILAVSLHVYHPPLTTMTHYDLADNHLIPRAGRDVDPQGEVVTADRPSGGHVGQPVLSGVR